MRVDARLAFRRTPSPTGVYNRRIGIVIDIGVTA
jgi:hypothetical protein